MKVQRRWPKETNTNTTINNTTIRNNQIYMSKYKKRNRSSFEKPS